MKQDNKKNSYNAVPDAAVKTTPTGRRVVLAAALSFCLGALARPSRQHEVEVHQRPDLRVDLHERQQEKPLQAGQQAWRHGK